MPAAICDFFGVNLIAESDNPVRQSSVQTLAVGGFAAFQILKLLFGLPVAGGLLPPLPAFFDRPVWRVVPWIGRSPAAVQSSLESADFSLSAVEFSAERRLKALGLG